MTSALILNNLVSWSAQVAILVTVGFLASLLLVHPRARLLFWQAILAAALLLPLSSRGRRQSSRNPSGVGVSSGAAQIVGTPQAASHRVWKREYFLYGLAVGALLRPPLDRRGIGSSAPPSPRCAKLTIPPVPFSNPSVRWFISSTVGGPVTFGFLNPSILLPARVAELPADLREAIAHHELAHVRRADWLFVLAEEAIRSLLWFHPAIWFVLSRIQLAREQVVDAEVVGLTCDRQRYLHALVAVAAQRLLPDVAPAPLFLKKRQLAQRVAAVLKETRMSKPRAFLSFTTVSSAALVAARLAIWMFPMQAPAQTPQAAHLSPSITADGPGVTVQTGAKILHRSPVFFPSGVTTTGSVIVESTVNSKGEVTDARVLSGPEELRSAALSSVLNWHFSPDGGLPSAIQSTIFFVTAPKTPSAPAAVPVTPTHPSRLYVKSINTSTLSAELATKVMAAMPIHEGDAYGSAESAKLRAALQEVDEHLAFGLSINDPDVNLIVMLRGRSVTGSIAGGVSGGVGGSVGGGVSGGVVGGVTVAVPGTLGLAGEPETVNITARVPNLNGPTVTAPSPQSIRVGGNVQSMNLIKKVTPAYPPDAKMARIQGTVRFTATIGKDGSVLALDLVSGHPMLVQSAHDAVAQWMYRPTLLNGEPVQVITQIDVNYSLSQ